jgi:hypothetical protein
VPIAALAKSTVGPHGQTGNALLYKQLEVLCCVVLCCAVLCYAVLCCAVLCCAVLCCAVLCCAVLCCAVLCYAVLRADRQALCFSLTVAMARLLLWRLLSA